MAKFRIHHNEYDSTLKLVKEIKEGLIKGGWTEDQKANKVICVGGDGTVLKFIQKEQSNLQNIELYTVHSGGLGFYTDFNNDCCDGALPCTSQSVVEHILNNEPHELNVSTIKVEHDGKVHYALNELNILSPFVPSIFSIYVDGVKLQKFRATGIAVATPSGSTGYAKSVGGAVIDNDIEAMEILEVATCSNNVYRSIGSPVIIAPNKTIEIKSTIEDVTLSVDAHLISKRFNNSIKVTMGPKVKFLRYSSLTFLERVSRSFVLEGNNA